jgi:L-lactate dehydrogenase complex protein LldG
MSNAREEILRRVRTALVDVPTHEQPNHIPVDRSYRHRDDAPRAEIVARFAEEVADYKAVVHRIKQSELTKTIAEACKRRKAQRMIIPTDLPQEWLPKGIEGIPDNELTFDQLDSGDGVLTGCALGIAQTGTIVLDSGPRQGRRAITLLPDYHLCVVFEDQVVGLVPEAITQLSDRVHQTGSPITFISGPSATSDIELNRVEGVHGPRTLEVLIVAGEEARK